MIRKSIWGKSKDRYGMPVKLFGDRDKDRVMNVFDCKPGNKRRQDVISPVNLSSSPMNEMISRQESGRQIKIIDAYNKELKRQNDLFSIPWTNTTISDTHYTGFVQDPASSSNVSSSGSSRISSSSNVPTIPTNITYLPTNINYKRAPNPVPVPTNSTSTNNVSKVASAIKSISPWSGMI